MVRGSLSEVTGTVGSACRRPHRSAHTPMRWPWSGAPALPPTRTVGGLRERPSWWARGGEVQAERPLPQWSATPGAKEGGGNSPSHVGFRLDRGGRERRLLPLESVLKVLVIVCVVPGLTE